MRNEEVRVWLNGFPNLHHANVSSQPSTAPTNAFPMWGEDNMINHDHDVDVLLSNDFARMGVFGEKGNGANKTRGYGHGHGHGHRCGVNVMDSSYIHAFPPSHPYSHPYSHSNSHSLSLSHTPRSSSDGYAHVGEERGALSSAWGMKPSSDVKGHSFGPPMEFNQRRNTCYRNLQRQNPFHARGPFANWEIRSPFMLPQSYPMMQQSKLTTNVNNPSPHFFPAVKERAPTRVVVAPSGEFSHSRGDPVEFQCDGGFIMQEKDVKWCVGGKGCNSLRAYRGSLPSPAQAVPDEVPQFIPSRVPATRHENNGILASDASLSPRPLLFNFGPLVKFQGYIYHLAKDQNGCRFLQRMVGEGTSEDAQIVFNGVIDDVVELMMDPFGNYLVQKLIDVCAEDERFQIVSMLTREPGQLLKTSFNTHGTRVVQKLIATVNSRNQIALLRSAIQPDFLDLIKDLNGNHVIQRCLQYFSCKDNEFIFDAATNFCVDIATHEHGCCVLQRCIDYSTGKYQDKLIQEICRHGLILAQDPFGNYVVQYIIEMEIPSTSSTLHFQFKGNYVNLSMQKFSSHVVEKCLMHIAESRSGIVQEMLSFPHFERLLPDPYANYVVQRALGVTKGSLHTSLVEAVRPHKILRTNPYCKRIFSRNILNK